MGVFDPNQLPTGNISGKALQGQQQQIDMTNFHYYDNFTRSLRWTGKVILDLIPKIYDKERVVRIIGEDGKPDLVTVNQQGQDENGVEKVLNDVTVGEYDVVMDTGPGFNSKRQEGAEMMMGLFTADPALLQTAGDLLFRNMDFPGSDIIADRLAAANPLAQIDEKSNVPPQVQMQLAQSQQTIQQLQQELQALQLNLKYGVSVKQMQEQAETSRELMRQTNKAHEVETMAQVKVDDQNTRATTAQNKIEIEAFTDLLLHHMDTRRLEQKLKMENEQQAKNEEKANKDVEANKPQTA